MQSMSRNSPTSARGAVLLLALLALARPCAAEDSAALKKIFADPPRQYASAPLWVWNDMLTEAQIRDTMRDLASQKVKQVFVHPRPGLMTPYLGKEWFALWRAALQEAAKLDMNVWIYDENSYPSGFAGGWVPELMPEARGRGLRLDESQAPPAWNDAIIAVQRIEGGAATDVTAALKSGQALPAGRYVTATLVRAGNSPWHGNRCYVDLLYPGVTEKFLEVTLEAYRRELGAEFGNRIPGAFTDEPQLIPAGLPWTADLPARFAERRGYGLVENLASLAREVGDWRRVRHDYYKTLLELFIERWGRPYYEYCARNKLEFTGHYWEHEWPNCTGVPDNMAMAAWQQRPGIDTLMNQYAEHTHAQFGNVRACREVASIANQLGRARTLVELYGAGGWDLRFEDMKRIGDWLQVLGINTFDEHLSYVTLRGARKRDHPQSFSYHEPWWEGYHVMASYFTRLTSALSHGAQVNRVLVLEPTTTAWMYQGHASRLGPLGDGFFGMLMQLEAAQVEYDLGCEDVMARHGKVAGKELAVGQRAYPVVVLGPATENLERRTAELLGEFLRAGGTVLCVGEAPTRVDGRASDDAAALAKSPGWKKLELAALLDALRALAGPGDFALTRAPGDKGILFHHRRLLDDGQLLFLVNTSITDPAAGVIESALGGLEAWNLATGAVEPYAFRAAASGITASFTLPPSGSLLLFLATSSKTPPPPVAAPAFAVLPAKGPMTVARLAPNVLTLDYVDVTAGGETRADQYFYQANQFAWQKNGLARDPWDSAVQFKDELIARTFPPESGFTAAYKFAIESAVPADLVLVVERPDLYRITCNGTPVAATPGAWWLDRAFGKIDISAAARTGENVVTLTAAPFTMYHELEPAYVLGNFTLKPAARGFVVAPDAPLAAEGGAAGVAWNAQGQPFYAHGVAYTQTFALSAPAGRYRVKLPAWYGSVAKVVVNKKVAGYIAAPPWECDVTADLGPGENEIVVVVIGTLKNLLGPHHGNPGLGSAWPGMFQQGPKNGPPPGGSYHTVGYGLFAPFVLEQSK
jgi:hypothetical protein